MQYLANVQTNIAALPKQNYASSQPSAASGIVADQDFADILKASNDKAAKKQAVENSYQQKSEKKALTSADNTGTNQHQKNEKINNSANQTTSKDKFADSETSSTPEKQTDKYSAAQVGDTSGKNQTAQTDEQKTPSTSQISGKISSDNSPIKKETQHSVEDSFIIESADAELVLTKPAKQAAKLENADEFDFLNFLQKAQNNKAELKSAENLQVKVDAQSKTQLKAEDVQVKEVHENDIMVENAKSEIEQPIQALTTGKVSEASVKQTSLNQAESTQKLDDKKANEQKTNKPDTQVTEAQVKSSANVDENEQALAKSDDKRSDKVNHSQAVEVKSAKSDTQVIKQASESGQLNAQKQDLNEPQSTVTEANPKETKANKSPDVQAANQQAVLAQTQQQEKAVQQATDDDKIVEQTLVQSVKSETPTDKKADPQNGVQSAKAEPTKLNAEGKQTVQSLNANKEGQTETAKELIGQDKSIIDHASLEQSAKQEVHTQQAKLSEHTASADHKPATAQVSQQIHKQEQQFQQADKNVEKQQSLHHQLKEQINLNKNDSANALNDSVKYMMNSRIQSAEIRIDPPELGSMQIKISMNGDQASVSMVVQNQQAKDILDQSVPKLKEMLEQQGIQLGESNVSEHQSKGEQQAGQGHGDGASDQPEDGNAGESHQIEQTINNGHLGTVDYYA
ncbi:flagellar hook-length control protein FliK [Catenovulum adriaticum]|uniref:Flagellar hook-length control protein FliK n=1 Tax=Catenovulum adriaticum TaxID=2984846 RepID=A0ABY7AJ15_9ALTE|nr:flagellar hook-length control protein FliK [Catenovulum sp. TS8]WAJ69315.1 flagellar hook-length control protein FliK [Catenovulum sp. TS8]